ncbi:hypothetical protein ACPA9J_01990 [Pseudomonas aeruginosa]
MGYGAASRDPVNHHRGRALIVQTPGIHFLFSTYPGSTCRSDADRSIARRAKTQEIATIFDTLQVYLGSSGPNDFNQFGRTVWSTAIGGSSAEGEKIIAKVRTTSSGEMVPLAVIIRSGHLQAGSR